MRHDRILAVVLLTAVPMVTAGCATGLGSRASAVGGGEIHARVVASAGGARLVIVPVYFSTRGPYDFALDTGAARSVVDERVATQVRLRSTGSEQTVTGVSGTSAATRVRTSSWRVDSVQLPDATILSLRLPTGTGPDLAGLLGSDMLSRFRVVTIDYTAQTVKLS